MAEPKKLPNGRWQVRYRDPEGRPCSKVCDTKAEARDYVQDVGHAGRTKGWAAPELGRIRYPATDRPASEGHVPAYPGAFVITL